MQNMFMVSHLDEMYNRHLLRYASLLATSLSHYWITQHKAFPMARSVVSDFSQQLLIDAFDREQFIVVWDHFFSALALEDVNLRLCVDDVLWCHNVINGFGARDILSLILALATSRRTYVTMEDVAEETGMTAAELRTWAITGRIPGAYTFDGKRTFVFFKIALLCAGINVEAHQQSKYDWLNGAYHN